MHGDRSPAAAVALLRAAGIPATVVHRFDNAARHPLVLSWPRTRLGARGRARVLAYVRNGGTFLAVTPSKAVRAAIGAGHAAFFTRLVQVPERGLVNGGHLRDGQIAALRRFWAATPGGFRLGDAPNGATSALVLLHDVRGLPALRASKALLRREHRTGVHATYVLQTRYLADARGAMLVGPALEQLVQLVRSASADAVAGGVAGGPLAQTPRGSGGEAYPTYAAAFASSTEVDGETLSGELRVSRYVLGELGAGDVQAFRGVAGDTPRGFAAIAEASGIDLDATLSVDDAGGAFPFWQVQANGLERRLLRFPVAFDDVPGEGPAAALAGAWVALRRNHATGAPTLVELTPDRRGCAAAVERALLADTPPDVWRGTLDRLGRFWDQRAGLALDARPLGARLRLARAPAERAAGFRAVARRAVPDRACGGRERAPAEAAQRQPRGAPGVHGKDRRGHRPRAREGQPVGGSGGPCVPPSCDSAPAAAHTASQAPQASVDRKPRERDAPSQTTPMTAVSRTASIRLRRPDRAAACAGRSDACRKTRSSSASRRSASASCRKCSRSSKSG